MPTCLCFRVGAIFQVGLQIHVRISTIQMLRVPTHDVLGHKPVAILCARSNNDWSVLLKKGNSGKAPKPGAGIKSKK